MLILVLKKLKSLWIQKGKIPLQELSSTLEQIIDSTDQDEILPKKRKDYLSAELKAMQTTLKILKGEEINIVEETQGLYGLIACLD